MRICLSSTTYPPGGSGGIPRQRQILAAALARLGHEVHVITQGQRQRTWRQNGAWLHSVPSAGSGLVFSERYPFLNPRLAHSLAVQEQIRSLHQQAAIDVLDAPLWALEAFVPLRAREIPVVLWLQTSYAQMVAMGQQPPSPDDPATITLERECLRGAQGIIADSQTVLVDFAQLYQLPNLAQRARVVHLGLPDLPHWARAPRRADGAVEALLVGRLEKRKGTAEMFELLPELLRSEPRLRVRFIGADNSRWDGFADAHGQSYPEYFYQRWPALRERVLFEGAVSDRRLNEAYLQANLMLVPSLYESFGIIYLEAMRAGLPVVTFANGAAPEIFPRGTADGACVVAAQQAGAFRDAVLDLAQNAQKRAEMGANGRARFTAAFLDTRMAEASAEYYRQIAGQPRAPQPERRIFQVMEAPVPGDAVSTIALQNARLLRELGAGGTVLSLYQHPQLRGTSRPVEGFHPGARAALIFHHWNYSNLEDFARQFPGPKAVHFHNITPPEFFAPDTPAYESTSKGYAQLRRLINLFDLLIGDSTYNIETCLPYLDQPKPALVVPPLVDLEQIGARAFDAPLLRRLQAQPGPKILFVGRVARNKRQDRLVDFLAGLRAAGNPGARLYLVGGHDGDPAFHAELQAQVQRLGLAKQVILTGKVSDAALASYYRAADLFASASQHEGFGMPLIEAMAHDLPVLAFAAGAVPETMGSAGMLVEDWNPAALAQQVMRLFGEPALREAILTGQRENLARFSASAVKRRLAAAVRFLRSGAIDPETFFPGNPSAPSPRTETTQGAA